ncbi:nucleotide-binding protein [Methanoplanus endosymbiosus]|uniref:Nucleotide-binding protein n=1 Tax=Methanoplanus endosymbiosus TaxID=33865 RepID=A0A9E7PJT6_9EURY|nr:nucleotide-binding protein [Methanoplanus endosymbiosus]UUX91204.1 nucleotide-binding protein [Methanoplanus endosymbiosus]
MDIDPVITERISLKIKEKGIDAGDEEIAAKLRILIEDFHIPPEEAEKTVTDEILKENKIRDFSGEKTAEMTAIADAFPGEWVTVEGKVVSLSDHPSESIAQSGVIADKTGAMNFVIWKKAGAEELEELEWYRFESAVVDEFRGAPSLKVHSGTTVTKTEQETPLIPNQVRISDLKPGVATLRAKVVRDFDAGHERMLQAGLLGDETGTVRFVTWKGGNSEVLEEDKIYTIYYAEVNEYQGKISLNITGSMVLEDEDTEIDVYEGDAETSGVFIHMGGGSGLIKRCPVEGCNRTLSRQNFCTIHEVQNDFRYDLRITGVIDDGKSAKNIIIQRAEAERITGITMDEAVKTATDSPLGYDDVVIQMKDALLGRYFTCKGNDMDGTILVKSCTSGRYDSSIHAGLINRTAEMLKENGGDC